jgi:hypothetical protein
VDRGEPAEPKIAKALRHFFGFGVPVEDGALPEYATVLVGMVAPDASAEHERLSDWLAERILRADAPE